MKTSGPKPPDPVVVEWALAESRKGRSHRDIARELTAEGYKTHAATIGRWLAKAKAAALEAKRDQRANGSKIIQDMKERFQAPAPEEPEDDAPADEDTLGMLRRMLKASLKRARVAEQQGNHTAAQRAGKTAADLANTIARVEKTTAEDSEVLRISRKEISEAMAAIYTRITTILDRPGGLVCAGCGRKISIELAGAKRDGTETEG